MAKTQTNFTADSFGTGRRKSRRMAGTAKNSGAEDFQPESALNQADYYDEATDSGVKFRAGAQNETGGNLVKNPSDATEGHGFSDVGQDLPSHMVRADDDEARESDRNAHVHATVDEPMGNTAEAEVASASGVTAKPAADRKKAAAKKAADTKKAAAKKAADKK